MSRHRLVLEIAKISLGVPMICSVTHTGYHYALDVLAVLVGLSVAFAKAGSR